MRANENPAQNSSNSNLTNAGENAAQNHGENAPQNAQNRGEAWARFLAHSRTFDGDRASNFFALRELTPRSLGALIAIFEHRTFVEGVLLGVNSFDQWGVELGKKICGEILQNPAQNRAKFDASTAQLAEFLGV